MPTYLGRKKNGGPYYAKSEGYEKEFSDCDSRFDFYAMLRRECNLPPTMSNSDVYQEISSHWTITADGFVRDSDD